MTGSLVKSEAAARVDLGFLDPLLAEDVRASLNQGLLAGAVFASGDTPDDLFRAVVGQALTAIEAKPRSDLLHRFLDPGPLDQPRCLPTRDRGRFMSDRESDAAVRFIHASVINAFQGALAELLAVGPICALTSQLFGDGTSRVFVGDCVRARKLRTRQFGKGADLHVLTGVVGAAVPLAPVLRAIAEVKSYSTTASKLQPQLRRHLRRARLGLLIRDRPTIPIVRVSGTAEGRPTEIVVVPGTWHLSRKIRFDSSLGGRTLAYEPPVPPTPADQIRQVGSRRWLITLRWSEEALAAVAYEMTFWYFGEVGGRVFAKKLPPGLEGMSPEQAGRNVAKQSLQYAILRARTPRARSRAVALYNSYGFGYALGAHFVDQRGRREVMDAADLDEIACTGRSRTNRVLLRRGRKPKWLPAQNCRIAGS